MEVDEGNQSKISRHANFEAVDDEEFFEFQEVDSHYNTEHLEDDETPSETAGGSHKDKEDMP